MIPWLNWPLSMMELGYARGLEPVATLDEVEEQLNALMAEYDIQPAGEVRTVETSLKKTFLL